MVKYNLATLQAMVGTNPTGPIDKIHERLTFSTLWHIQRNLFNGLHKVENVKFPLGGHAGYILSKEAFVLFLSKYWKDPKEVGEYYIISVTAISET